MGQEWFENEVDAVPWGVPSSVQLMLPTDPRGVIVSGYVGASARQESLVEQLASVQLATLSVDLLPEGELCSDDDATDVQLLAVRLLAATRRVRHLPVCADLPVGYAGTGVAGAAALWAASEDMDIAAVVCRDGWLDLVSSRLPAIFAPTLLVVAAADPALRLLNEQCGRRLRCEHQVVGLPVPPHLDAQETLAAGDLLARDWFADHVGRAPAADPSLV